MGFCGVVCDFCPFYSKNKFFKQAIEVIEIKFPKVKEILEKLKELKCDGCPNSIFGEDCEVRKCAIERNNQCIECVDFPCEKLIKRWKNHPGYLDKLKNYVDGKIGINELILIPPPKSSNFDENLRYVKRVISETHMERWIERVTKGKIKRDEIIKIMRL